MEKFQFEYELLDGGWSKARISNGEQTAEMTVTCLSQPLKEMVTLACFLLSSDEEGASIEHRINREIAFADEPGGYILNVLEDEESVELPWDKPEGWPEVEERPPIMYEVWKYDSDSIWPGQAHEVRTLLFVGECTIEEFAQAVHTVLEGLILKHGFAGYESRWMAKFPLTEFAQLSAMIGRTDLAISLTDLTPWEDSGETRFEDSDLTS
ncbi:MAG: hypothetical protein KF784_00500 [Fimbriimonadaceae bacterium]|nr:hypothetical protein [Fimbriimonadaceae bacterium]